MRCLPEWAQGFSFGRSAQKALSTPGQIVIPKWQVPIALPRNLEDCISNAGLHRGCTVVTHATEPVPCLEESDVDFWRVLVDARQREFVEVVLCNAAFDHIACLKHRVVVKPGD